MKNLNLIFLTGLLFLGGVVYAQEQITGSPELVEDVVAGVGDGGAQMITSVDDRVYYEANGTLWMYDGSTAAEINFGADTYTHIVGVYNDNIYLEIDGEDGGGRLARHDGSSVYVVANLGGVDFYVENTYAIFDGDFYFVAQDEKSGLGFGAEIWKTDGTTTTRVTDIAPGDVGSDPQSLTVIDNVLYFTAIESTDRQLYSYDGASVAVVNNTDGSGYTSVPDKNTFSITSYNGELYFTAYDATNGNDLWTYDGSMVSWFSNDKSGNDSNPGDLTVVGAKLYWLGDGASATDAMYAYNGSSISIYESTDVNDWDNLSAYGDQPMFTYQIISNGQYYLTTLNGTVYHTIASTSGYFESYVRVDEYVYYNIELDPGVSYQLGVREIGGAYSEVFDINTGGNEVISNLALHHTTLFFEGDDGTYGKELWKVRNINYVPEITNAIPDTSLIILDSLVKFDLTAVFTDQDNDELTFSVLTAVSGVLDASISGDTLVLDLNSLGTDTISVTATEALGNVAGFDFIVNVINPYLTYSGADFTEVGINDGSLESGEMAIAITGDTFVNAGGALTEGTHYTINNLPAGFTPSVVVNASGDTATVTLSGQAIDHDNSNDVALNFTFTDAAFVLSDVASVTGAVDGNSGVRIDFDFYPPVTIYFQILDITRVKGADTVTYALGYIFENPGEYALDVTATSSNETVATTSVVDGGYDASVRYDVNVTPLDVGTSTITITVTTEHGAETSQSFNITVTEPHLTFSPAVSLLDDITLTYEGKRTFQYFDSPYFSPDGTKILRQAPLSLAYQMDLNVAGDITFGATNSEKIPPQPLIPIATEYRFKSSIYGSADITFNADGSKTYIAEQNGKLKQFTLAVPYNLRSASALEASITPSLDGRMGNIEFSADGNYLFYSAYNLREIQQLELTSPFDVSGGLTKVATFSVDTLTAPYSYGFTRDGSMIYVVDDSVFTVSYYKLAAPYDLSTAPDYVDKYQLDTLGLKSPEASSFYLDGIYWSKDARKLYAKTWEKTGKTLHQYAVSGGATSFTETAANTGAVEGELLITTNGSTFVNAGGTLTAGTHFTIDNLPAGIDPVAEVSADGYQVVLTLNGQATAHSSGDNIASLQFTFYNAAFESGAAGDFSNAVGVESGFGIGFTDNGVVEVGELIADSTLYLNNSIRYDMSPAFYISPEEALTYEASVSDEAIAQVTISGTKLVVKGTDVGNANITVIATDALGNTASQIFAIEVLQPFITLASATGGFTEAEGNDGSIIGELSIAVTGDILSNTNDILEEGTHFTLNSLPAGLSATISVAADGLSGVMSLSGQATNHDDVDGVTDLEISFTDAAFNRNAAADIENAVATGTGAGITFIANPIPEIIKELPDTTVYLTAVLQYNLGEYFSSTETLSYTASSVGNTIATATVATGVLSVNMLSAGSTGVTVTATGESGKTISQSFAITVTSPYLVFGEDDGSGTLTGGFTEADDNTGAVEGSVVATVYGNLFSNAGGALESGVHFTVDNLPAGFNAAMTVNAAGNQATLTLTGQAASHDIADDVADLQVSFTDAAFELGQAAGFTNAIAASTGFGLSFIEAVAPAGAIADVTVVSSDAGTSGITISLADVFTDAATLAYTVTSSNEAVATAAIVGTDIIITPVGVGVTTITVTATTTSAGGRTQSETVEFDVEVTQLVAAINDSDVSKQLLIYPNPTAGDFTLDLGREYSQVTVEITDVSGHVISREFYESARQIASSIDAKAGIYILRIVGEKLPPTTHRIIRK